MLAVIGFRELKSRRYGPIVFSSHDGIKPQRKRVGHAYGLDHEPIPLQLVYQVFTADPMEETLLAFKPSILPEELRHCFQVAKLEDDLAQMCADVVFCSHLRDASLEPPQWIDGFVLENGRFSPDDVKDLSRRQIFLPNPYHTVFVNGYTADGSPLCSGFDFFKIIVHYVGFLKARAELLAKGHDPDAIHPDFKEYAACCYESQAAGRMLASIASVEVPQQTVKMNELVAAWLAGATERAIAIRGRIPPAQLPLIGSVT